MLGVSDVKSLKLYRDVLGYDHVVMDETGVHPAFTPLPSGAKPTAASSSNAANPLQVRSASC